MLYATYYTQFTTVNAADHNGVGEWWPESGDLPHAPPHIIR